MLNLQNLKYFKEHVPHLLEVSIGHSLISDAPLPEEGATLTQAPAGEARVLTLRQAQLIDARHAAVQRLRHVRAGMPL